MRTVQKDIVAKYLAVYAEPEAQLGIRLQRHAEHVLVIPAQAESISLLDGYRRAFATVSKQGERTLCIVVVNCTDTHDSLVQQRNDALVHALRTQGKESPLHQNGEAPCWCVETPEYDLVVLGPRAAPATWPPSYWDNVLWLLEWSPRFLRLIPVP